MSEMLKEPQELYEAHKQSSQELELAAARIRMNDLKNELISISSNPNTEAATSEYWQMVEAAKEIERRRIENIPSGLTDGSSDHRKMKLTEKTDRYNSNLWQNDQHKEQNLEQYKRVAKADAEAQGVPINITLPK